MKRGGCIGGDENVMMWYDGCKTSWVAALNGWQDMLHCLECVSYKIIIKSLHTIAINMKRHMRSENEFGENKREA